jgi:mRNA interferase MazF
MPQVSEIVLLPFPFTDLSAGKRRPVLVPKASNSQGDFVVAQITSQLHHHPSVRLVPDDFELGSMPKPSIVRTDKIFTLNESLVARRIGRLRKTSFQPILDAICEQLNCLRS